MTIAKLLPFIIVGAVILLLLLLLVSGYVKAPANKAFIISGLKKEPKVLIGRAGIRIPFFLKGRTNSCSGRSVLTSRQTGISRQRILSALISTR